MTRPMPGGGQENQSAPDGADAIPDYLWDRSDPVDPLVERLEGLLAGSGLQKTDGPVAPAEPARIRQVPNVGVRASRTWKWLSLAAVLALAMGAGAWYVRAHRGPGVGWVVAATTGSPLAGGERLQPGGLLERGDWLTTDSRSTATVKVADIGSVVVSPNSRLRIEKTGTAQHVLNLDHGQIEATISAPPKIFLVQTRAALATDMGCRYDLDMPESGPGLLTVTLGWVQLDGTGATPWVARVPRGSSCAIDPRNGPGTPYRVTSRALRDLLKVHDSNGWLSLSAGELREVLEQCGTSDGVTLWHLLYRVPSSMRAQVCARLGVLYSLPADLDSAKVVSLDAETMDRLWSRVAWD